MKNQPIAPRLSVQLQDWDEEVTDLLEIDDAQLHSVDLAGVIRLQVDGCRLESVVLTGAMLDKFELTDSQCVKLEAAALRTNKANLLRVTFTDCRLTGAEFADAHIEDCTFKNVKFDEAGFRFASFKRVRFENCILHRADFSNAKFEQVTFMGRGLTETIFMSATCKNVDVTTEDLTDVKGVLGLKGATISEAQLLQLAPLLAAELGFQIEG
ncbi:MAG TPA: pentapeptide repeat-containing protein [Candidatus Saccharimonadia bacterium]|nr:pentapeptide repeat-containing protein [Candidatus Saccharimonadia bacterium]